MELTTLAEIRRGKLRESLKVAAARLGISPSHLCNLEKRRREPSAELVLRISREYREEVKTIVRLTTKNSKK